MDKPSPRRPERRCRDFTVHEIPQPFTILTLVKGRSSAPLGKAPRVVLGRVPEADAGELDRRTQELPLGRRVRTLRCELPCAPRSSRICRAIEARGNAGWRCTHPCTARCRCCRGSARSRRSMRFDSDRPPPASTRSGAGTVLHGRSNRSRRYELRDLGDRRGQRPEVDFSALRIAQRHLPPERSPAPRPRALAPGRGTVGRRPVCDEGCGQQRKCEDAEQPHQRATGPHPWGRELHQSAANNLDSPARRRNPRL